MLSDNIRNYRKENNMSQDELAEKLDVSRQSVSLWENGQTQPTIDNIVALSKIFNVSANDLLGEGTDASVDKPIIQSVPETGKKNNTIVATVILVAAVIILLILVFVLFSYKDKILGDKDKSRSEVSSSSQIQNEQVADNPTAANENANTKTNEQNNNQGKNNTDNNQPVASTASESFDLFSYCKDFAIKIGKLNGDYTIYQQPSKLYGGYDNEYFSLSYWSGSDMVEFCLHCPLDDIYSINFYLRMRGGYNGKYEYSTSRYYRSSGDSVRSASGYIDPSVFSQSYPLGFDNYSGTVDKQTDFMEESRVGICDLIKCLKKFTEVEKMECSFDAFGFINF